MIRIFKSEIYKILNSKFLYFNFGVIFLYALFANYLYLNSSLGVNNLYLAFNEEFTILYLILSLFYSSFTLCDELLYKTINDYKITLLILCKTIIIIIYLFLILIFSLAISYNISLFMFHLPVIKVAIIGNILKEFVYVFPMLLELNLIVLLLSVLIKKANLALGLTYLLYFLLGYVNNWVLSKNSFWLYYLFSLNWNFNNHNIIAAKISVLESVLVNTLTIFSFVVITIWISKWRKKN